MVQQISIAVDAKVHDMHSPDVRYSGGILMMLHQYDPDSWDRSVIRNSYGKCKVCSCPRYIGYGSEPDGCSYCKHPFGSHW